MASNNLTLKYRPQQFSDLIGQKTLVKILQNIILYQKINHAYLFSGKHGVGKTTMARIFARAINCQTIVNNEPCEIQKKQQPLCISCAQNLKTHPNIIEIDGASNNGVDEIRALKEVAMISPSIGKFKVYIIDEVHMLTMRAFNAFLKLLEEPPKHVVFILATTEIHKIPATIISRCQWLTFQSVGTEELVEYLQKIVAKENWTSETAALQMIVNFSKGSVRDALNTLLQISWLNPGFKITKAIVEKYFGNVAFDVQKDFLLTIFDQKLIQLENYFYIFAKTQVNYQKLTENLLIILKDAVIANFKPTKQKQAILDFPAFFDFANITQIIKILMNGLEQYHWFFNDKLWFELNVLKIVNFVKTLSNNVISKKIKIETTQVNDQKNFEQKLLTNVKLIELWKNKNLFILEQIVEKWRYLKNYEGFPRWYRLISLLKNTKPQLYSKQQLIITGVDNLIVSELQTDYYQKLWSEFTLVFMKKNCQIWIITENKWAILQATNHLQ